LFARPHSVNAIDKSSIVYLKGAASHPITSFRCTKQPFQPLYFQNAKKFDRPDNAPKRPLHMKTYSRRPIGMHNASKMQISSVQSEASSLCSSSRNPSLKFAHRTEIQFEIRSAVMNKPEQVTPFIPLKWRHIDYRLI
jgi:hypothetical protein